MERDSQDIFLSPPYPRRPAPSTSLPWLRGHDDRDLFEPPIGESERRMIVAVLAAFALVLFVAVVVGVAVCVAGSQQDVQTEGRGGEG